MYINLILVHCSFSMHGAIVRPVALNTFTLSTCIQQLYFTAPLIFLFSTELKELEAKLRSAYMNKERHAQMAEKEALKEKEQHYEALMSQLMEKDRQEALRLEEEKEKQRYEQSIQYKENLQTQLHEKVQSMYMYMYYTCHIQILMYCMYIKTSL